MKPGMGYRRRSKSTFSIFPGFAKWTEVSIVLNVVRVESLEFANAGLSAE
jgi:hypothetical protein